ncbi:MAG: methylenetetrahydrofolate reductase [NAD(P)H] [Opitutaceae bacterium]|nr:methylenetetrahydrofolate reductase [NAD(P)H] [Opitutaceae bacterium]
MIDQQPITQLLARSQPLLSVEFYPPKTAEAVDGLVRAANRISESKPDFISVTYGAGGSTRDLSATVSRRMKDEVGLQVMPHFTCVGSTREELGEIVDEFYNEGYRNIMALRGDPPQGHDTFQVTEGGFAYASDLVAFIKERHPDMCIGIAGYPEKHPEAPSLNSDLDALKIKADAGGSFITTQLFFENDAYFRFVDHVRARGIHLPIIPGIMPVLSLKQIKRITQLCQSQLPKTLESALSQVEEDPDAVRRIGIDWAQRQIAELIERGAEGVHIYALNKAKSAIELINAARG